MTGILKRDSIHNIKRLWEKKGMFSYSYILLPIFFGIIATQMRNSLSEGMNTVLILTAILVSLSNADFTIDKKLGLMESLISLPVSIKTIVFSRFTVTLATAILVSLFNLSILYVINYFVLKTSGIFDNLILLFYFILIFSGTLVCLSVWLNNIVPRMFATIVSISIIVIFFLPFFSEISPMLVYSIINVLLLASGILNYWYTLDKQNMVGD
ncbi:MAG: hypothetical protein VB084_01430 [Syntrophomonadaceae bacterium]|nr:hypothetical protein [Syntrophomonadaceae bacterium]